MSSFKTNDMYGFMISNQFLVITYQKQSMIHKIYFSETSLSTFSGNHNGLQRI